MFAEESSLLREAAERRDLRALALVLTARGIDSRIDWQAGTWRLVVAAEDSAAAQRELATYERENMAAPQTPALAPIDSGWWGVAAYLAVIWATMALANASTFGWNWPALGRLHAGAVLDGEVWRLATALTLHADVGHLVANSVFGGLFGLLAGRYLGTGLAWLGIVLGGTLGNALNALVRPEVFVSIGASTATFAALGLAGAFLWRSGYFRRLHWPRGFAPVFAAIALFAYTGTGGERTDVVAHLAGLGCGFLLGIFVAKYRLHLISRPTQRYFGGVAAAWIAGAWLVAG